MVLHYKIIVLVCRMQNNLHNDLIVPFRSTRIMYLFSLMVTVILPNYAKIVKNVAMTGNRTVHMKTVIIHFILNSFLTKHYKTSSF